MTGLGGVTDRNTEAQAGSDVNGAPHGALAFRAGDRAADTSWAYPDQCARSYTNTVHIHGPTVFVVSSLRVRTSWSLPAHQTSFEVGSIFSSRTKWHLSRSCKRYLSLANTNNYFTMERNPRPGRDTGSFGKCSIRRHPGEHALLVQNRNMDIYMLRLGVKISAKQRFRILRFSRREAVSYLQWEYHTSTEAAFHKSKQA